MFSPASSCVRGGRSKEDQFEFRIIAWAVFCFSSRLHLYFMRRLNRILAIPTNVCDSSGLLYRYYELHWINALNCVFVTGLADTILGEIFKETPVIAFYRALQREAYTCDPRCMYVPVL